MKKILVALISLLVFKMGFALNVKDGKIYDDYGNSVEYKEYSRIILLDPAVVENFYMLGAEDKIVAIASTSRTPIWPEEKTSKLPTVGSVVKPSLEKVIISNADLVILNPMITGFGDSLKSKKVNFLINQSNNFDEILGDFKIYGAIAGKEDKAQEIYANYVEKLERIKSEKLKNKRELKGLFVFSASPMMAFSEDALPGQIFKTLGVENISAGLKGSRPIISSEYLVTKNPDFIVGAMSIQNKDDILRSNPVVANTTAGKNGNIYVLDSHKILRATPRIIDELSNLDLMLEGIVK